MEVWKIIFSKYIVPSDKILDIGCGVDRTTFGLYSLGFTDIMGIDFSEEVIAACNHIKIKKEYRNLFYCCWGKNDPFTE